MSPAEIRTHKILILLNVLVVFFVAANLRAPFTAVGPVLNEMVEELSLSNIQSSLLTSIPLLMFAGFSIWISNLSARKNGSKMLLYGMLLMLGGTLLRLYGNISLLMAGSALVGIGICVGNVVTPGYIKMNLSKHMGLMTGLFALSMNLVAAFAAGLSVDIGNYTQMGWRGSLGIWSVLQVVAILILVMELLFHKRRSIAQQQVLQSNFNMFKSRLAWYITIVMGLQSIIYYSIVAWFPVALMSFGMSEESSGWVLFAFQISALPFSFIGPVLANRMKDQKWLFVLVSLMLFVSMALILLFKTKYAVYSAILLGGSNGMAFSICLLFFSIRTQSVANSVKLSGMAQAIGYFIAAFGPLIFGGLRKIDVSWSLSFYFIVLIGVLILYFGIAISKDRTVEEDF